MNRPTFSDVFDINKKTGALILGKNRLDDYATKYLAKHYKEALETPMPLPVDTILQEEGLTIQEVSLSKNLDVFGCCLLLDGEVDIYDRESGLSQTVFYPAGTVLIDPDSEAVFGEGAKRNTLIHEALHWEKDKKYFEILALKNTELSEKLCPIMCRQSETFYEPPEKKKTKDNEVKWLEWQAHRLAPRILMPIRMFKKKALEFIDSHSKPQIDSVYSCSKLIDDLSSFFIVSRESVKYRLIEVGLLEKISQYNDFNDIYDINDSTKNYVAVTPNEAYQLLGSCSSLSEWTCGGHFVFVDGYFVLADERYIAVGENGLSLTAKARKNLDQCVINIREQKYTTYQIVQKDLAGSSFLCKVEGVDQRLLTFHPKFQTNLKCEPEEVYAAFAASISGRDENEEIEITKKLGDPTCSLCQCLWFLIDKRGWKYPRTFRDNTGLNENYYGKIRNNNYNNMGTNVLMAICVGLKLSLRLTEKLFDKSQNKLNYFNDPDKTYINILERLPGLSLQDFNGICNARGVKQLGSP